MNHADIIKNLKRDKRTGCLVWTRSKTGGGYGHFRLVENGKVRTEYVHRYVWMHAYGPIPDGLVIRHKVCRNPSCGNLQHLDIGTPQDNANDRESDGTTAYGARNITHKHPEKFQGEHNGASKLTAEQVREIFALRRAGGSGPAIAKMYGVKKETVYDIESGRRWKSLGLLDK